MQKGFYGKSIGEYIYKFWNFDNRFLVRVEFKFLKLRYMLHVFWTFIVTLAKEIDKNK